MPSLENLVYHQFMITLFIKDGFGKEAKTLYEFKGFMPVVLPFGFNRLTEQERRDYLQRNSAHVLLQMKQNALFGQVLSIINSGKVLCFSMQELGTTMEPIQIDPSLGKAQILFS